MLRAARCEHGATAMTASGGSSRDISCGFEATTGPVVAQTVCHVQHHRLLYCYLYPAQLSLELQQAGDTGLCQHLGHCSSQLAHGAVYASATCCFTSRAPRIHRVTPAMHDHLPFRNNLFIGKRFFLFFLWQHFFQCQC
jgi:hypothetical protein